MHRVLGWGAICAVVLATGCSKSSIKVDGSSTVLRVSEAVVEEFRKEQPEVRVTVGRAGTGGGFKKLSHGEIDICDASRPINEIERQACEANGIEFVELEIAFDGLTVVVNPKNNWCDCLSVEQLKALWQPESAVNKWSDLNPAWPDREIKLYGPGTDSGTFDYFTEAIVGKAGSSRADYSPSEDDNSLVTGVAGDADALGYFGLAYYEENQNRLKVLGIDPGDGKCVIPSQETVRDHSYKPLSRPLFIYVRKSSLERSEVRSFVEFYLDQVGNLVEVVGYVPLPDDVLAKSKQNLAEVLSSQTPKL
ncbi:MAG: PstS family phosphate ABC transporter substrate-binding protein [Pirellulales bacterium]